MGIGSPDYILEAAEQESTCSTASLPPGWPGNGALFTDDGILVMKKAIFKFDQGPIEEGCTCRACTHYSRDTSIT